MIHKITDSIIIFIIVLIIFVGANQACKHNGGPKNPLLDNSPVPVINIPSSIEGPTPFTVELDGSNSYSPDGGPVTFNWLFSDGEISTDPTVEHEFTSSGRHSVILAVTNQDGITSYSEPLFIFGYGLANSPWPKFAHDEHNTGISENPGPMMDMENADSGGAFPRYWRGGIQNDTVTSVCIGYDGMVVYTQGEWLRARTPYGGVLWDVEFESTIKAWPAILHDGSIVTGTDQGWVHRIDMDGEIIWSTDVGNFIDEDVILDSAVNVGHDGTSYIAGFRRESNPHAHTTGWLFALTLDGEIRWVRDHYYSPVLRTVPVIGIDRNIIINGLVSNIYTPSGTHINSFSILHIDDRPYNLGPACVNQEGNITFSNTRLPVFNSNGEFQRFLIDSDWLNYSFYGKPGRNQAPLVDSNSTNLVLENYYFSPTLVTRSDLGDFSWITSPNFYSLTPFQNGWLAGGASEDSLGRIYMGYQGIRAFSPLEGFTSVPYLRRHSLWAYKRPAPLTTAPAIGEDGWLYVGCGDDILAIGD